MIPLQTLSDNIRIFLYSFFIFCILCFFYKLARHPRKSYDLLMILILIGPLFVCAVLRLLSLLGTTHPLFPEILRILAKFGSYWIVCLAIYHYSILKSFQEKFSQFPFKAFTIFGSLVCLSLSFATNFDSWKSWNGDFFMIDIISGLTLWFICYNTFRIRHEINFGPFNINESASKLIRFSCIQGLLSNLYAVLDILRYKEQCLTANIPPDNVTHCQVLGLINSVMYQCFIWYAILLNWKLIAVRDRRDSTSSLSSFSLDTSQSESVPLVQRNEKA